MSYYDIATLSHDQDMRERLAAATATEGVTTGTYDWVDTNIWSFASQPGWGDAYASAIAGGVPRPGLDPSVISDPQILSAVQAVLVSNPPA